MQLTKSQEDRLVALSGVAQEFTTQGPSAKLVCGLRLWCLGVDLLWKQDTAGIHSRYMEFPSWSWASVNASVSWIRTDDATDCFSVISVPPTPGGRAASPAKTGGNSTSPISTPSGVAIQALASPSFAPEASMNTLNIRCSLATEKDTVAGWGSLEDPDLQVDDAFARNPIIFALCISVLTVPRGSGLFSKIWGGESIFNVLLTYPTTNRITDEAEASYAGLSCQPFYCLHVTTRTSPRSDDFRFPATHLPIVIPVPTASSLSLNKILDRGLDTMKQLSKLKKKLRSSDSANQQSSQPAFVPGAALTSQVTTPSCNQSTGPFLAFPVMSSPSIISPSTATTEPAAVTSPLPEPQKNTSSVPERLWNKAYSILGEKEPEIFSSYQEILNLVHHEWDDTATPEELQYREHCKTVKSRQMWRLVYSGLEKSKRQAKYKENLSTIIETIDNIKGVVEKAVKYSSEAAIAWAGILSNPMKEPGLDRKGIAYVLSRMEWYWNLAELVLKDNSSVPSAALRINLETQIIEFYKKLLLFQMRSACLYYRNWAGVIFRDTVKLDDWSGELNTIKDAERLIRKDIEQHDNQDICLKLSTIEASAVGQAESLESICKILREEARSKEKNAQGDKDKECLRALLVTDPSVDKKRIQSQKGDPLKESYEWILKSDAYEKFISDPSSRVLWIHGPPGKGKTMLLCGIIDGLKKSPKSISFFLCQGNVKEEDLSSDIAVMRGLIYVLLEHQPSLISPLRESYDKQKDRLFNSINSSELLRDVLTKMLRDPCLHDTILILDALYECNINRSKLTNLIVELSKSSSTKWIVSSRNWPEIHQELAAAMGLVSLDLEKEHESVSQAVKLYISKKVDDLARTKWQNDLELKEKVFDYLQSHADDTFLWVALVCERLANSGIRKCLVMEELVRFPTSLTALYQVMMDRITDSSEADRLKQVLALVCVVYRPLTSAEIPTFVESMDDYDEHDVEDAIASCSSFLTLQDGEIFFVHQSAKEFLLHQGYEVLFPHGINHKHADIFYRSLAAMETTLRQNIYELGSPSTLNPVKVPSPDPLCVVKYPCVYWAQHLFEIHELVGGTQSHSRVVYSNCKYTPPKNHTRRR
ncbi:het-E-1 heterokaryon incompatibility protein [Fusarium sp. NRRL 25303]|nr:het-E-1 heterokaryon incompatibility protein [Fusarium sp. NRRL 25303]